jgi:hypothetical protein
MEKKDYKAPQGTFAMMLIFLLLIVLLWGNAFLQLLSRGVTQ